jgi:hypothetical protein
MTLTDELQTVRTFGELRIALLRARKTPRTLDFMAFNSEQAEAKRLLREQHDVGLEELQRYLSTHHREIDALAEAANVSSSPAFVMAVARIIESEPDNA